MAFRRLSTSVETGLAAVQRIVAVASCKGGVGKSTVAANVAFGLKQQGLKVGLLDCDVHGPSLPTLLRPVDERVRRSEARENWVLPLEVEGVKCLSFGWVSPKADVQGAGGRGAALLRGPQLSRVVVQLLCATDWGELDYLVLDTPPGTGDALITLCQSCAIDGVVLVTTPAKVSYVDVVKGLEMFHRLRVPTISVVENMAYFKCPGGSVHYLFGRGSGDNLARDAGLAPPVQVPISEATSRANDMALPLMLVEPASDEAEAYRETIGRIFSFFDNREDEKRQREAVETSGQGMSGARVKLTAKGFDVAVQIIGSDRAEQFTVDVYEWRRWAGDPKAATALEEPPSLELLEGEKVKLISPDGAFSHVFSMEELRQRQQ